MAKGFPNLMFSRVSLLYLHRQDLLSSRKSISLSSVLDFLLFDFDKNQQLVQ